MRRSLSLFTLWGVMALSVGLPRSGFSQTCDDIPDHFSFRENTGDFYAIVLDSTGSSCEISECDEIGVFDGDICVGASVFSGAWPLSLLAWQDDDFTDEKDGYTTGNSITFRLWSHHDITEYSSWTQYYSRGDGHFDSDAYAQLWLGCPPVGTGSAVMDVLPSEFSIQGNYPNPFNQETRIRLVVSRTCEVSVQIYDILGRHVRDLLHTQLPPGSHTVSWKADNNDGTDVASGVYFCRAEFGNISASHKLLLLK